MKALAINNGEPIMKEKFKENWPIISEEDIKEVENIMKKVKFPTTVGKEN